MSFQLLSRSLQKKIWDMKWASFTPIQDKAIPAIIESNDDVILSAGTASGKTEAAFLPILTKLEKNYSESLKVLYVSPLKALINNQFERIEKLCEYIHIDIHRWHGDVPQSKKKNFVKHPNGILQITPESLESLFINRPGALPTIFKSLEFIIIDEVHSFIDSERGVQLRSLLSRIEVITTQRPRIIGLSATINNFDLVRKWVNYKNQEKVQILEDKDSDKQLMYCLMHFQSGEDHKKPVELYEDMREITKEQKAIIFCNSRGEVEEATVFLNRLAERERAGESYYPHHSSIDKKEREYVEKIMADTTLPKSVIATSSLELGIDIGNVDLVIQLDSTFTVSSLKQRLGRSGRKRDAKQILQLYSTEEDSILQALAVMELVLDKWIEPTSGYAVPYDILFHQILSICAEKNGVTKSSLIEQIKGNHIFHSLSTNKVEHLINHMMETDMLERIQEKKELIVGLEGERILRSKDFYAVFMTKEEYEVLEGVRKIGRIDKTPFIYEGDNIILAGKIWTIKNLDTKKNKIYVNKAVNGKAPKFFGDRGKIHKVIGEKMHEILCSEDEFGYIDNKALDTLEDIRKPYLFNQVKINERVLWKDKDEYLFETFTSTQITTTLFWMLKVIGVNAKKRDGIGRIYFQSEKEGETIYKELQRFDCTEKLILEEKKKKEAFVSKFSPYLPVELQDEMHSAHELDLRGTLEYLEVFHWKVIDL